MDHGHEKTQVTMTSAEVHCICGATFKDGTLSGADTQLYHHVLLWAPTKLQEKIDKRTAEKKAKAK